MVSQFSQNQNPPAATAATVQQTPSARFKIEGWVSSVGPVATFGSGFTKRAVVIETSTKPQLWPSPVAVQLKKERTALGDALQAGQWVTVEGFIEGRAWERAPGDVRHFVDLTATRIVTDGREVLPPADPAQDPNAAEADMPF